MISSTKLPLSRTENACLEQIFTDMEGQVLKGHFTAWSAATPKVQISASYADEYRSPISGTHPYFDLGSLTKPLLAGTLFAHLHSDSFLQALREPVKLQQLEIPRYQLFSHTSGLAPWIWFGRALYGNSRQPLGSRQADGFVHLSPAKRQKFAQRLEEALLQTKGPAGTVAYSDLGYVLLAQDLESTLIHNFSTSSPLTRKAAWLRALDTLNDLLKTEFRHASLCPDIPDQAVPFFPYIVREAETPHRLPHSVRRSFGAAHDTNANILASLSAEDPWVSSHAGLFGSVTDVQSALQHHIGRLMQYEAKLRLEPFRNARFVWCYDTPQGRETSAGVSESEFQQTYGHLGYTGTSFWMQTTRPHSFVILLTNRTATRQEFRSECCPRVLRFDYANQTSYFQISGTRLIPLQEDDFQDILATAQEPAEILWNTADCRTYPSIQDLRRRVHTLLWTL